MNITSTANQVRAMTAGLAAAAWIASSAALLANPAIEASADSLVHWKYDLSADDNALLDSIEKGCFQYFWKEVGSPAKLAKDKTTDTVCSIAAVGFQLSSLPVGVERGWITRPEGEQRAITVLKSLVERRDNKKFGIYLHFLDERTGGLP